MGSMITSMSAAFSHGGFLMWAIVPVQIVSLAIIAERVYALYFRRELNQKTMVQLFEADIRKGQIGSVGIGHSKPSFEGRTEYRSVDFASEFRMPINFR